MGFFNNIGADHSPIYILLTSAIEKTHISKTSIAVEILVDYFYGSGMLKNSERNEFTDLEKHVLWMGLKYCRTIWFLDPRVAEQYSDHKYVKKYDDGTLGGCIGMDINTDDHVDQVKVDIINDLVKLLKVMDCFKFFEKEIDKHYNLDCKIYIKAAIKYLITE